MPRSVAPLELPTSKKGQGTVDLISCQIAEQGRMAGHVPGGPELQLASGELSEVINVTHRYPRPGSEAPLAFQRSTVSRIMTRLEEGHHHGLVFRRGNPTTVFDRIRSTKCSGGPQVLRVRE